MSFYEQSDQRRQWLKEGKYTIIPFALKRFRDFIPGLIHGDQLIITANTGLGKSRFMRKICVKDPIKFAEQTGIKLKIFLNSLEETVEKVQSTFVASALYELYGIDMDYYTLNHYCSVSDMPDDDTWVKVKEAEKHVKDSINKYLEVIHISNAYGIYKHVRDWLAANGTFSYQGKPVTVGQQWDHYEYNDPNTFVIVITDTVNKMQPESEDSLYRSLIKFSSQYSRRHLGMSCGVISVLIQQQSPDKEKLETNLKGQTLIEKMKCGLDTLRDCRATQEDATIILGLFDPTKYHEYEYKGYPDLRKLKGDFRVLQFLKVREAKMVTERELPLIAYFSRDDFEELPLPGDNKLTAFYTT